MKIAILLSAVSSALSVLVSTVRHPDFGAAINVVEHVNTEIQSNLPAIQAGEAVLSELVPGAAPITALANQFIGGLASVAGLASGAAAATSSDGQENAAADQPPLDDSAGATLTA